MLRVTRPGTSEVQRWLTRAEALPLPPAPPRNGAVEDHNRVVLGRGAPIFARARDALRHWEMFRLGWVEIVPPTAPIRVGTTVGVLVRLLGLWSLNPCRIVAVIDDGDCFGFVYRTLPGHEVEGEGRFAVEWQRGDDAVTYDLQAWSRPRQVLARLGLPLARRIQRRFARDSLLAMRTAVAVSQSSGSPFP